MKTNKSMYTIQFVIAVLVAIFVFGSFAWAATYYVDATNGNDDNDGQSPSSAWMTISKINNSSFAQGDSILFKRGETWNEQLSVPSSGSSGNPITFGDYGSDVKPIIDGEETRTYCINVGGKDFITFQNLHLKNAGMTNLRGWGARNITVEDVDLEYPHKHNAYFGNGSDNLVIRRCTFHHAAVEHGIYIDASDYPLVEYSVFHNNKRAGIKFNSGGGIGDVKNPIVRYNTFYENNWGGISDYAGYGGKYYYNLFYSNIGYSIGLDSDWEGRDLPSMNNEIYNNTIYQHANQSDSIVSVINGSTGHIIKNNIIYRGSSTSDILIRIDADCSATLDHNAYYGVNLNNAFQWHETLYSTLSSWQSASNQDAHSIASDPEFNNVNSHDFTLKETSPCIDAGLDAGLSTDMAGTPVPLGLAADIGAFEHYDVRPYPPTGLQVVE